MIGCAQHTPEHYMHGASHFYRCSICGIQLFSTTSSDHPSVSMSTGNRTSTGTEAICKHCGHGVTAHDGGCNASVREGVDGVSRCHCSESYGEPS